MNVIIFLFHVAVCVDVERDVHIYFGHSVVTTCH